MSEIQNNRFQIRYRKSSRAPEFETDEEEYEAMRDYVQQMLAETSQESIVDTLLLLANLCEMQSGRLYGTAREENWGLVTADILRTAVSILSHLPNGIGPDERLENPHLYWPDMEIQ